MDNRNVIAILIAVYNRPQLLQTTLNSIVDDRTDIVVVVVDDGSRPPLIKDALAYPGALVLLTHGTNQGLVAALNTGLKYIRESGFGFMARLDAGDVALAGRFSSQREFLLQNPAFGLVGSRIREIGRREVSLVDLPSSELKKRLHIRSEFAHPAVMLSATAFCEIGNYDPLYAGVEDWDYWLRLAKRFEVKNLPEVLTELDGTPGSISRDTKYKIRIKRRLLKARLLWRHFDRHRVESYIGFILAVTVLAVNLIVPPQVILARPRLKWWH